MGLELRLAWRNIWRNSRRTALTVAATVFSVFLVVVFVAMAAGVHEKMIEDSVRIHSGHLQLAGEGYLQDRTLDQYLELGPGLLDAIDDTPGVVGAAPRVVAFGLLSKDEATRGVVLFGVDPARESSVTTLSERISKGAFLPADVERPVVLGERLASRLGAELGDSILLYSVAYSMEMAYELFTVAGLVRLPEPNLEGSLALITLADAQAFFAYGNRVSEVALLVEDPDALAGIAADLRGRVSGLSERPVEVNPWNQVMPELEQFIFLDDAGMYIMLVILVVVVAFGILNTILMSVLERTRELGVMLAVGLRPWAIFRMIYLESLMLAGVGLLLGLAIAIPVVLWFQGHPVPLEGSMGQATELLGIEPVMTWKLKPLNPIGSSITIFGVAALAALYPALKASRSRPVDALRSL